MLRLVLLCCALVARLSHAIRWQDKLSPEAIEQIRKRVAKEDNYFAAPPVHRWFDNITKYATNIPSYWKQNFGWCYNGKSVPCLNSAGTGGNPMLNGLTFRRNMNATTGVLVLPDDGKCCIECYCERNQEAAPPAIPGARLAFGPADIAGWLPLRVAPGAAVEVKSSKYSPPGWRPQRTVAVVSTPKMTQYSPTDRRGADQSAGIECCTWCGGVMSPWVVVNFAKQPVVRINVSSCGAPRWFNGKLTQTKWALKMGIRNYEFGYGAYIARDCDRNGMFEFKLPYCFSGFTADHKGFDPMSQQNVQFRLLVTDPDQIQTDLTTGQTITRSCEFHSISVHYDTDPDSAPYYSNPYLNAACTTSPHILVLLVQLGLLLQLTIPCFSAA